ncbi:hypothetical protein RB195_015975 [Necator americanus]|uniref:HMG box domain-containing protein n=1 Tax=Necator americanus TaxID=51031 RepID=A0ABR1E7M7_NECAM
MDRPKKAAASSSPKKSEIAKNEGGTGEEGPECSKTYSVGLYVMVKTAESRPSLMAADEKKRYEKEMAAYKAGGSASSLKKAGKARAM